MDERVGFRGVWLLRAVGVLGLLVGVFAMHGLTAHHDAAMAGTPLTQQAVSGQHAPTAGPAPTHHAPAEQHERVMPADRHKDAVPAERHEHVMPGEQHQVVLPLVLLDAFDRVVISVADGRHEMVSVCVAVLTGLVLLLALALAARSLLAWRPVLGTVAVVRLVGERAPPWLVPELSKLGVLRI
ncbi:hypothetical protein ACWCOV_08765 [Kribbella sp. NPDC002412]